MTFDKLLEISLLPVLPARLSQRWKILPRLRVLILVKTLELAGEDCIHAFIDNRHQFLQF